MDECLVMICFNAAERSHVFKKDGSEEKKVNDAVDFCKNNV